MQNYDVIIIGGGVIGSAVARELCRYRLKVGVLEKECMELNRKFIVSQTQGRPFVTLKWAESADGFMAPEVLPSQNIFISTPRTLMRAHRLRSEHQAVMIGRRTAQLDNPSLTVRRWSGPQPLRVVLDRDGVLSPSLRIFDGEAPTLVCGGRDNGVRRSQADCDYIGLDYTRPVLPRISSATSGFFFCGIME